MTKKYTLFTHRYTVEEPGRSAEVGRLPGDFAILGGLGRVTMNSFSPRYRVPSIRISLRDVETIMSSESGVVDAATIEKTKQQIRGLVREIAQLSRTDVEPEQYYAEVMSRIVTALAAVGGAVWTITAERQLRLDYQINLNRELLDNQSEDSRRHVRLLQQVITSGEAKLVPPMSGSGDPDAPGNPTQDAARPGPDEDPRFGRRGPGSPAASRLSARQPAGLSCGSWWR